MTSWRGFKGRYVWPSLLLTKFSRSSSKEAIYTVSLSDSITRAQSLMSMSDGSSHCRKGTRCERKKRDHSKEKKFVEIVRKGYKYLPFIKVLNELNDNRCKRVSFHRSLISIRSRYSIFFHPKPNKTESFSSVSCHVNVVNFAFVRELDSCSFCSTVRIQSF